MNELFKLLTESPGLFQAVSLSEEGKVFVTLGCTYGDGTLIELWITEHEENYIVSDRGRTRQYMDKIFELSEPDVIKNIVAATEYYDVHTKDKQLSVKVGKTEDERNAGFIRMQLCISFLDNMKFFYI